METQLSTYEHFRSLHTLGKLMDDTDVWAKQQVCRRLSRILKWDPEDTDSDCQCCNDNVRSEAKIRHLLYLFKQWLPLAEGNTILSSPSSTVQMVAYSVAKLCYWEWLEDSSLVEQVLRCIYECDGSFSGIFTRAIDEGERRFGIWYLSRNSTAEKEYSVVVYFLHHAVACQMVYNGVRFLDMEITHPMHVPPVMAAAIYIRPQPLMLFLRYGALLYYDSSRAGIPPYRGEREWDVYLLLKHLLRVLWSCLGNEMVFNPHSNIIVSNTMQNVCFCLRILLRAIPQVDAESLCFPLMTFQSGRFTRFIRSEHFIRWISINGFVPKLSSRCYEPSQLQHLCRCEIRNMLNKNWRLPQGIYSLDIPTILKKYLDLSED